jgi:hypothetical protein
LVFVLNPAFAGEILAGNQMKNKILKRQEMRSWLFILLFALYGEIAIPQVNFTWGKVNYDIGQYGNFVSDASGNIYQAKFSTFSKFNSSGDKLWTKDVKQWWQSGTTVTMNVSLQGNSLIMSGAIYVWAGENDSIDFDPGPGSFYLPATKEYSAFIAKYTLDGTFIWAKKIEAKNENNFVFINTESDNAGNIYASSLFRGTVDFDPGPAAFNLTSVNNTIYIAKYNSSGNLLWAKNLINNEASITEGFNFNGLTYDNLNRLTIAGRFKGTKDFDPGAGIQNRTAVGIADAFLAQYDNNGNFLWAKNFGDTGEVFISSLTNDLSGNIYAIGMFTGTVDFDPGAGVTALTAASNYDLFAAKYTSAGNFVWAKHNEHEGGGTTDPNGNLYLFTQEPNSSLINYSSAGALNWNQQLTMPVNQVVIGGAGEIFLTGIVSNAVADLDPGPGDFIVIGPERDGEAFVGKYSLERTQDFYITDRSQWKYLDNGSNQGTSWRNNSFSDGSWKTGIAELGYGDDDEETRVLFGPDPSSKYLTTYFRKKINIANLSQYSGFELRLLKDDGAVVYVNGTELLRTNMPGGTISYTTSASSSLSSPAENTFTTYQISSSKFVQGENTIAVEVHQASRSSSDLSFNLTLKGIISTSPPTLCAGAGSILREFWLNVSGSQVTQIPLANAPSGTQQLTSFEGPTNAGDNYGDRIKGFICPPLTGNYTFWIASDNNSELWLSTNDDPANKRKIAYVNGYTGVREWNKYTTQKSAIVQLVAGTKYYIETLHKEGSGGDNLAVGWQLPNGNMERPVPGSRLFPAQSSPPPATTQLIAAGGSWKYLDNGSNQGTAWRATSFSDATWKTGIAELGYGDGDETTVVSYGPSSTNKYITTYFRKSFNVADVTALSALELHLLRDDGAVVYINGTEVYRSNMPTGTITYTTLAPGFGDVPEGVFVKTNISKDHLVNGTNIIAVEVHQNSASSSDLSFNLKLNGILAEPRSAEESTLRLTQAETAEEPVKSIFTVFPNPTTGIFTLEFCGENPDDKKLFVEILDMKGQSIYRNEPQVTNGCVKQVIELDRNLPHGIYILNIVSTKGAESKKMLLSD